MPGINTNPKIVVETTEEFEELMRRLDSKSMSSKSTFSKSKRSVDTKDESVIESKEDSDG